MYLPYHRDCTIAAIATPFGQGAIAIVRLSGNKALDITSRLFTRDVLQFTSHTVHAGTIRDRKGQRIDSVLLLIMKKPRSYTGEDIVEIHCHGGMLIPQKILRLLIEEGAKIALPGEFTYRAFKNGKIDLAQAEAVQSIISSENTTALKASENQLEGLLSKTIRSLQKSLIDITASLEASLDFPEDDIDSVSINQIKKELHDLCKKMKELIESYREGKMAQDGISLCIIGTPNVGKSSLFNAILQEERSIVTPIEGTTRDIIEQKAHIRSFHFHLMDTAGIHQTDDSIETEGIARTKKKMKSSDLILLLLDASKPLTSADIHLLETRDRKKTIVVWNKIDIAYPSKKLDKKEVLVSAKYKTGLDNLYEVIEKKIIKTTSLSKDGILLTKERHKEVLEKTLFFCEKAIKGLGNNLSLDLIIFDLKEGLQQLATILGMDVNEEILSSIFSKFCVGK